MPINEIFHFFLRKSTKNWTTAVYRFSISYLVLELQSFEDAKIKAKSKDSDSCDVTYIE